MEQNFYIGRRISYERNCCTVRYVGPVKGTQGQWLGVEWDDPIRGKHSGEHEGVRYFQCRSKLLTAGSFVRPNRPIDSQRSFLEALNAKYAFDGTDPPNGSAGKSDHEIVSQTASRQKPVKISGKVAEEVGFDKVRRQLADLHELRIVILDGMKMSQLARELRSRDAPNGDKDVMLEKTQKICPRISELDLSRNLFEHWSEITYICSQLAYLRSLRLDGNRLEVLSLHSLTYHHEDNLERVVELSLSNTLFSWKEIAHLTCRYFGRLTSLIASNNEISALSEHPLPHTLRVLDLEDNDLTTITDIQPLAGLPRLQRLSLRNNKIRHIAGQGNIGTHESDGNSSHGTLPRYPESLIEVDLSYNEILDWSFISALHNIFSGLTSLRIAHNPLFQNSCTPDGKPMTADDGHAVTIARLPRLKSLNFSPVTAKDRFNSETYYLSLIAAEMAAAPEGQEQAIARKHWRYKELCDEYGDPVIKRREVTIDPSSLAARLVKLHCRVAEQAVAQLKEGIEAKFILEVPKSLQVYSVMGYVGKRLGVAPMKIKLVWETDEMDPVKGEDSDSDDDDDNDDEAQVGRDLKPKMMKRDVVVVAGTRTIGTWIEGNEAKVRVELREHTWHSSSETELTSAP